MLLVVMGMGRSGTSVLMQILEAAGFDCGSDWIQTNENNPRGYYERKPIVQQNIALLQQACPDDTTLYPIPTEETIQSMVGTPIPLRFPHHDYAIKDPRFSLTFPLWQPVFQEYDTRVILAQRNTNAIAESMLRAYGIPPTDSLPIIEEYRRRSRQYVEQYNVRHTDIIYEDWFSCPEKNIDRLQQLLDRELTLNLGSVLDRDLHHCKGDSSVQDLEENARFQKNWVTLKARQPELAARLEPFLDENRLHLHSQDDRTITIQRTNPQTGEQSIHTLPRNRPVDTAPFNRYQGYDPERHWLLLIGFSALHPEILSRHTLGPLTPILVIETEPLNLLLLLHTDDYTQVLSLPALFIHVGPDAFEQSTEAFRGPLLPYFQTTQNLHWIPGPEHIHSLPALQQPLQLIHKAFQLALQHVQYAMKQAIQHWTNTSRKSIQRVALVLPSAGCWLAIGQGLSVGFQELGVDTLVEQVSYPPSSIRMYDSLRLRLMLCRFLPDVIITISHSSDLLLRGMEDIPIRRVIWYVDQPDHLIQYPHNRHDILVPCWREFEPMLKDRSETVHREIPVGSVAIQTSRSSDFEHTVLFVGSIADTTAVRQAMPDSLRESVARMVELNIAEPHRPIAELLTQHGFPPEDLGALLHILHPRMKRPGMTDQHILHYFLQVESNRIRRVRVLEALQEFPLAIYGSVEWATVLSGSPIQSAFQQRGLYSHEYYQACASATITLNIHPCFPHSGPTIREFETVLCGGFLLTDMGRYAGDRLSEWFDPQQEIALYHNEHDIAERVRHFLENPEQRAEISRRAIERIRNDHTYRDRAARFKSLLEYPS